MGSIPIARSNFPPISRNRVARTALPAERYITLSTGQQRFRDWGGVGQPILLLHGLASHCGIWDLTAPILATRFRTLALDLRGHGRSHKPDAGYDFDAVTNEVVEFCDTLGLRTPAVVGHSWGGNVALHLAASYPRRVRALIMVDGGFIEPSAIPGWTWEKAREELSPPRYGAVSMDDIMRRMSSGSLAAYMTPAIQRILADNFYVNDEGYARPRLSRRNHMQVVRALWEHKPSALFEQTQCPALLLPARNDASNPDRRNRQWAMVSQAERLLPLGETVWLEDTVHDVPLQRPALLARLISDFCLR